MEDFKFLFVIFYMFILFYFYFIFVLYLFIFIFIFILFYCYFIVILFLFLFILFLFWTEQFRTSCWYIKRLRHPWTHCFFHGWTQLTCPWVCHPCKMGLYIQHTYIYMYIKEMRGMARRGNEWRGTNKLSSNYIKRQFEIKIKCLRFKNSILVFLIYFIFFFLLLFCFCFLFVCFVLFCFVS